MRYINTKLVGVTFDNPDGENRQNVFKALASELRDEYEAEERYGGFTQKEQIEYGYDTLSEFDDIPVKLSCHRYEYQGKPALYLKCDNGILGNIPADLVEDVLQLPNALFFGYITGGRIRQIVDVEEVQADTLTYGMNVSIEIND